MNDFNFEIKPGDLDDTAPHPKESLSAKVREWAQTTSKLWKVGVHIALFALCWAAMAGIVWVALFWMPDSWGSYSCDADGGTWGTYREVVSGLAGFFLAHIPLKIPFINKIYLYTGIK